jgi:hypothetical protein
MILLGTRSVYQHLDLIANYHLFRQRVDNWENIIIIYDKIKCSPNVEPILSAGEFATIILRTYVMHKICWSHFYQNCKPSELRAT